MEADKQYTILDGLKLLSDEPFRKDVLKKVSDPYLLEWWARDFGAGTASTAPRPWPRSRPVSPTTELAPKNWSSNRLVNWTC